MVRYDVPPPESGGSSIYNLQSRGLPLRVLVRGVALEGITYRVQVAAPMDDFYNAMNRFKWTVLLLSLSCWFLRLQVDIG
jgi:hypothetical protein